jgi:hypothetical protein
MDGATLRAVLPKAVRRKLAKALRKLAFRRLRHRLLGRKNKPLDTRRYKRLSQILSTWG